MSGKDKIDPYIIKLMKEQEELGGIDTRKLEPGTRVEVQTKNSLYKFEFLDQEGQCTIQGGKFFPDPVKIVFPGSTWGGSMLKIGWIGYKMRLELPNPQWGDSMLKKIGYKTRMELPNFKNLPGIMTSLIFKAKVIGPDWEYEMDWQSADAV